MDLLLMHYTVCSGPKVAHTLQRCFVLQCECQSSIFDMYSFAKQLSSVFRANKFSRLS